MGEEFSEKEKVLFIMKREPDLLLWQRIHELASGSEQEKVEAVALIFGNYSVVPQEADDLLKEMAIPTSPADVRRKVATSLASKPRIPWGLHLSLLQILSKDKDQEVANAIQPLWEPYKAVEESLRVFAQRQANIVTSLIPKNLPIFRFPQWYLDNITALQKQAGAIANLFPKNLPTFHFSQGYLDSITAIGATNAVLLRTISMIPTSYFPIERESVVVEPSENPLIAKLKAIPSGREYWYQYQSMCKDILTFCFVPPLLDPMEESRTEGGLHRRDIIYPMSLGEGGFWGYLQTMFSALAMIVDAKNYGNELPKDQVVITSKYFGDKKLGNFGLIISRRGSSKSAKKEQIDRWVHHDEMIICLSDANLEEMLILKEAGEQPELVLDRLIRELRQSV